MRADVEAAGSRCSSASFSLDLNDKNVVSILIIYVNKQLSVSSTFLSCILFLLSLYQTILDPHGSVVVYTISSFILFADHKQSASPVCCDHHKRLWQPSQQRETGEFTVTLVHVLLQPHKCQRVLKSRPLKVSKHVLIRLTGTCSVIVAMETMVARH